jgi:triphosphatase
LSKSISNAFRSVLHRHWKQISTNWKKVQQESSVESVHDLRVGIRRMITVLEFFAVFEPADLKLISKMRKRFKKTLALLGPLRDVHVAQVGIQKLKSLRSHPQFGGFLKREAAAEMKRVVRKLTNRKRNDLRDSMDTLAKRARNIRSDEADSRIPPMAEMLIRKRTRRLENARRLFRPSSGASLHKMRIAVKKLRYCFETIAELFGTSGPAGLKAIEVNQKQMGTLRDLQLLEGRFRRWERNRHPMKSDSIQPILQELNTRAMRLMSVVKGSQQKLGTLLEKVGTKVAR